MDNVEFDGGMAEARCFLPSSVIDRWTKGQFSVLQIPPFVYYLGLGTNLGNKEQNLLDAVDNIKERVGDVVSLSAFYVTPPWGFVSDNDFVNAAACVFSSLPPLEVLSATQAIERGMGRMCKSSGGTYADRVIDIDLLLCFRGNGSHVFMCEPSLKLPHPLMFRRDFVMTPMMEIAGEVVHSLMLLPDIRMLAE